MNGQQHASAALYPRERPGTHFKGGWVDPKAGLDRCGKSRPHRDSIPDRPARSQSLYRLSYAAHSYLSSAEIKNVWSYSPIRLHSLVLNVGEFSGFIIPSNRHHDCLSVSSCTPLTANYKMQAKTKFYQTGPITTTNSAMRQKFIQQLFSLLDRACHGMFRPCCSQGR